MEFKDISLADAPTSVKFHRTLHSQYVRWVIYSPTTIDKDLPMGDSWFVILHWIPKIKKDIYLLLLAKGYSQVEKHLYEDLGIDRVYFEKEYKFFLKRLKWMHKNNKANVHFGETL